MAKTFFHPDRGHWVAVVDPGKAILATYPKGTVEIPDAPDGDHRWDQALQAWVLDERVPDLALEREVMALSFAQLLIGLVAEKWITEVDGDAWLAGVLPSAVTDLLAGLPPDQRFAAKARAARPSVVNRLDPLVVALGALQGKSPADLDQFFRTYATT